MFSVDLHDQGHNNLVTSTCKQMQENDVTFVGSNGCTLYGEGNTLSDSKNGVRNGPELPATEQN